MGSGGYFKGDWNAVVKHHGLFLEIWNSNPSKAKTYSQVGLWICLNNKWISFHNYKISIQIQSEDRNRIIEIYVRLVHCITYNIRVRSVWTCKKSAKTPSSKCSSTSPDSSDCSDLSALRIKGQWAPPDRHRFCGALCFVVTCRSDQKVETDWPKLKKSWKSPKIVEKSDPP